MRYLLILFFIIGCQKDQQKEYATTTVEQGVVESVISLTGRAEASLQHSIIAPEDLSVLTLEATNGQLVQAGELLCKLDPSRAQEAVRAEEQKLVQLESQIKTAQIRLGGLRKDIDKIKRLYASGAVSLDEKEKQEQELQIQLNEFQAQEDEKKIVLKQIEILKRLSDQLEIKAPITGVVTYVWIEKDSFLPGSSIRKGDLLFKLASQGKMMIKTTLREKDVIHFAQGQKLKLKFLALENEKVEGVIRLVDNAATIDKDTGVASFRMHIEFTPPEKVKPGMETIIDYVVERKEGVLMVPKSSLNAFSSGGIQVMTFNNSQKVRKTIEVGIHGDVNVEVVKGLQSGERVLANYEE